MTGCESVKTYCQWDALIGIRARQICPETCGCHDPMRPLAMDSANNGCPPTCRLKSTYKAEDAKRECNDLDDDAAYWSHFVHGLNNLTMGYPEVWRPRYDKIMKAFAQDKCAIALKTDAVENWRDMC